MKQYIIGWGMALIAMLASCEGTMVVTERPADPVYVRPASPGVGYIWVDGDWIIEGGHYVWHSGYWTRPYHNRRWIKGSWQNHGNGWHWRRGRWR